MMKVESRVAAMERMVISHFWLRNAFRLMPRPPANSRKPRIPFSRKFWKSMLSMVSTARGSRLNQPNLPNSTIRAEISMDPAVMAMVVWIFTTYWLAKAMKIANAAKKQSV
ncbi:hypothetical protein D3C79_829680 [compost metagenome]